MKVNKLVVIITNKKGTAYQVALDDTQASCIEAVISQLHGGKIKCLKDKLELKIGEK